MLATRFRAGMSAELGLDDIQGLFRGEAKVEGWGVHPFSLKPAVRCTTSSRQGEALRCDVDSCSEGERADDGEQAQCQCSLYKSRKFSKR